jgi:hypothetical protein
MIMAVTKNRLAEIGDFPEVGTEYGPAPEAIAQGRFHRSPYLPLRQVSCLLDDGILTLRGSVPTYYLKQLAQTIGASIQGVRQVINRLDVEFPEWG